MRKLGVVVLALVALIATACGSTEEGDDPDGPTDAATSAFSAAVESEPETADVEAAFRDAVRATVGAENIAFSSRSFLGRTAIVSTDGLQRPSGGWSATATFNEPGAEGPLKMYARSADGRVWMTMRSWPAHVAGCWLAMSSTQVPVGLLSMAPDEIGYVSLLADLVADDWHAGSTDRINGFLGMSGAQTLLTSQVTQEITLTPSQGADIQVRALVRLRGGRLAQIEIQGQSLADEIDRVGGTLSERARVTLNALRWTVSFADADTPPEGPPPPSLVLTEDQMDQGCH